MISRKIALFLLLACAFTAAAAKPQDPALYAEIEKADAELFAAFNAHDADRLGTFFAEDLEFYHDLGGLQRYKDVIEGFRSSMARKDNDLRRELVPGSLKVYPIPNFGAMQLGSHKFCHTENGKLECGVFDFAHVWQKKDGKWKVTRVLSFGH